MVLIFLLLCKMSSDDGDDDYVDEWNDSEDEYQQV